MHRKRQKIQLKLLSFDVAASLRRSVYSLAFLFLLIGLIATFALSIVNHSIIVWRHFHANIEIISPFITDTEEEIFYSEFHAMRTANDYKILSERVVSIAKENNASIQEVELWGIE